MQILKRIGLAVPTLVLAVSTVVAVPAFAEDGGSTNTPEVSASPTPTPDDQVTATPETATSSHDGPSGLRGKGSEMVQELRQEHKGKRSDSERQKTCESHKQGLTTKFSHIVTNSQRLQSKITDIMNKLVAYQQSKNLTVTNFDSLLTAAQTAEQTSAASITALQAVTPTLDCNSTSVAQDVATFKAAAQQTRDNLKAYRSAVKDLLVAIEQTKDQTSNDSTEGSNQ